MVEVLLHRTAGAWNPGKNKTIMKHKNYGFHHTCKQTEILPTFKLQHKCELREVRYVIRSKELRCYELQIQKVGSTKYVACQLSTHKSPR